MQKNESKELKPMELILKRLWAALINNWQWKLLSIFIALFLWGGLITQDDSLTREKVFNDVSINVMNSDTLRRNGYIIVSGLDNLPTVRLRVDVPQRVYNTVNATNYNVRIDLSKINGTGEQTLNLVSTNTTTYGSVTDISLTSITVQVEEYVTRSRIPTSLSITGSTPDGFYADTPSMDPLYVTVSGPKSVVSSVVRCVADYNMSVLMPAIGTVRTAVPFHLEDAYGNVIDTALVDITSESVLLDSLLIEQTLYHSKSLVIDTTDITQGKPADGYVIKSITADPATIMVAGNESLISSLNAFQMVKYIDTQIDVSNAASTIRRNVKLDKKDIRYLSSDTVLITVEIAPR